MYNYVLMRRIIIYCVVFLSRLQCQMYKEDGNGGGANLSCGTRLSCTDKNQHHRVHLVLPDLVVISLKETVKRGCLSDCVPESLKSVCLGYKCAQPLLP